MWDRMKIFYHVVKAGSFVNAEKILYRSQSTLSRTILVLEAQLGHRLLNRKIKGLELTRKGEEVFKAAQTMLMAVEGMKTNLNEKEDMVGKIRISTTYAIANYVLSDHILDFNTLYPEIVFEIICNDHLIDIIQNEVDISITSHAQKESNITQKHLYSAQASLYASQSYIQKFGTPKTPEDLDHHRLLAYSRPREAPYFDVEWHLKIGRFPQREKRVPVYTANSIECLFQAAERGVGIISGHRNMTILKKSKLIDLCPTIKSPHYQIYINYPHYLKNTQKIQKVVEFLLNRLKR